ncbi:MAG TPA: hypothetical protein VG010_06640 [Solirubrobacteraceae bacterium]|nr:hypothetical protein [Solirubrobacteraceae bacterium]
MPEPPPTGRMPTFCRHNRFIERCPICSKTLPGAPDASASRRGASTRAPAERRGGRPARADAMRVRREGRAERDGYASQLVPGIHASADASRLAAEIAFSSARLARLAEDPPGLYGRVRALSRTDRERATWIAFLVAYLSPLEADDPFAGVSLALERGSERPWEIDGRLPELDDVPVGPRTSHDRARGAETLVAYRQWAQRASSAPEQSGVDAAGGTTEAGRDPLAGTGGDGEVSSGEGPQAIAFRGDRSWAPARRFDRIFERLALPGLGRTGRYELLLTLGRLGVYELLPDSLHLSGAAGLSAGDPTALAAKRVFGIGDPLLLERRAGSLAEAVGVPIETLDLALANWGSPERATMGSASEAGDVDVLELAAGALGL